MDTRQPSFAAFHKYTPPAKNGTMLPYVYGRFNIYVHAYMDARDTELQARRTVCCVPGIPYLSTFTITCSTDIDWATSVAMAHTAGENRDPRRCHTKHTTAIAHEGLQLVSHTWSRLAA